MGCFDSTCMLTNQSIAAEEEVYYIYFKKGLRPCFYSMINRMFEFSREDEDNPKLVEDVISGFDYYNDYGSVHALGDYDTTDQLFLFHASVIDDLVEGHKDLTSDQLVYRVLNLCYMLRKSPVNFPIGGQHFNKQEYKAQKKLLEVSMKILKNKWKNER